MSPEQRSELRAARESRDELIRQWAALADGVPDWREEGNLDVLSKQSLMKVACRVWARLERAYGREER